jgi:methyltransferase (TIGR00027 family)
MKLHRASRTAEHNALFRAMEAATAPQRRLANDWLAKEFLGVPLRLTATLSRIPFCATVLRAYIDYRWPGSRTSLIARTRLIDDYLAAALEAGISQVVILGAGFDSRAYRVVSTQRIEFFEVDHPDTSGVKTVHLVKTLGALPGNVRFVPLNFQDDSLEAALRRAGFNALSRSLFIWEGVSNYLTEKAVNTTLEFIAGLAEGTSLVFTYVDEEVLRNPKQFAGGHEVQRLIAKLEEPWTFGLRPSRISEFFRDRGLCLDSDLSAREYRCRYYPDAEQMEGYEFYHVTTAHVPSRVDHFRTSYTAAVIHA